MLQGRGWGNTRQTLGSRESSDHIKLPHKINSKCPEIWRVHRSALHSEPPSAPCIMDLFFCHFILPCKKWIALPWLLHLRQGDCWHTLCSRPMATLLLAPNNMFFYTITDKLPALLSPSEITHTSVWDTETMRLLACMMHWGRGFPLSNLQVISWQLFFLHLIILTFAEWFSMTQCQQQKPGFVVNSYQSQERRCLGYKVTASSFCLGCFFGELM